MHRDASHCAIGFSKLVCKLASYSLVAPASCTALANVRSMLHMQSSRSTHIQSETEPLRLKMEAQRLPGQPRRRNDALARLLLHKPTAAPPRGPQPGPAPGHDSSGSQPSHAKHASEPAGDRLLWLHVALGWAGAKQEITRT